MSSETVQWLPALIALAIGVAAGIAVLIRSSRSRGTVREDALGDLEARRDAMIVQLRETEDPVEARELEIRAAMLLREIDAASVAPSSEPEPEVPPRRRAGAWAGFAVGAGATAVVALIVLFVNSTAEQKNAPAAAAMTAMPQGADLSHLEAAVDAQPDNFELRMQLAREYLVQERLMEVYAHTQYVLERSPNHPKALSYQAVVRLAMGMPDEAQRMLEKALSVDPTLLDAYVHLALVHATVGRNAEAQHAIEEGIRHHPEHRAQLEGLLAELRAGS